MKTGCKSKCIPDKKRILDNLSQFVTSYLISSGAHVSNTRGDTKFPQESHTRARISQQIFVNVPTCHRHVINKTGSWHSGKGEAITRKRVKCLWKYQFHVTVIAPTLHHQLLDNDRVSDKLCRVLGYSPPGSSTPGHFSRDPLTRDEAWLAGIDHLMRWPVITSVLWRPKRV